MKTRCPACGATASIDTLISHDEARVLVVALTGISDDTARAALRYLGLFRPAHKDLSWGRAAKLLGELVPLMQAGEISRNRKTTTLRVKPGYGRLAEGCRHGSPASCRRR